MSKPVVKLIGENGNIFNLIGLAGRALKSSGQADKAIEMRSRVMKCGSYDEAIQTILEYVEAE